MIPLSRENEPLRGDLWCALKSVTVNLLGGLRKMGEILEELKKGTKTLIFFGMLSEQSRSLIFKSG